MKYPGTDLIPKVGDLISCGTSEELVVTEIFDTVEKLAAFEMDEDSGLGIMAEGGVYGRVFIEIDDEDLRFLRRQADR